MSEAPRTPPYYADLWTGREEGLEPAAEAREVVDGFARVPKLDADWCIDGDEAETPFRLTLLAHEPGRRTVLEVRGGAVVGEVSFVPDPSGYVLVTGRHEGAELFRAYLDRPYEEFDLWPAGAVFDPKRVADAPCRIGKRRSWVALDTSVWPGLAALANSVGYLLARAKD